ncbi:thioesterase [Novosphingobium marinum]|nr:PaaI family thioesterase [Novosphingobium marinum]GGC19495.1 thioesterase [Novosphingobium marinum]
MTWDVADASVFNSVVMAPLLVRRDGEKGILRFFPDRRHANLVDGLHGGVIAALIDIALFAGYFALTGKDPSNAVTLDLTTQFVGAGTIGKPTDAEVELVRETGRFGFLRGLVVQDGTPIASFSGTIRKPSRR